MPVEAVTPGPAGQATIGDLAELEVAASLVVTGVGHRRAGAIPCARGVLRRTGGKRALHDVELPGERDVEQAERRRETRLDDAPLRQLDLDQVVEPFVEEDLGIEGP